MTTGEGEAGHRKHWWPGEMPARRGSGGGARCPSRLSALSLDFADR